jgi:prepilin-type N-terminal cleavage/methylation domain-containing protein
VFSYSSQRRSWSFQRRHAVILNRVRQRAEHAEGFSLPEILAVLLIIGILVAIAIPAFAAQTGKAADAPAKELAAAADTTAQTIATDNSGEYSNVTATELNKHEPLIRIAPSTTEPYVSAATSSKSEYSITVKAPNGDEFTIARNATGEITRSCASPVTKTGCAGAPTGSW